MNAKEAQLYIEVRDTAKFHQDRQVQLGHLTKATRFESIRLLAEMALKGEREISAEKLRNQLIELL